MQGKAKYAGRGRLAIWGRKSFLRLLKALSHSRRMVHEGSALE